MHQHSFAPPFLDVDGMGNRVVSETWSPDGITRTAKNFVRLTPDRQSKKGSLWANQSLKVANFTVVFEFRISGQGARFFGDGMALWVAVPEKADFKAMREEQRRQREEHLRNRATHGRHHEPDDSDEDDYSDDSDSYYEEHHEDFPLGEFHGYVEKFYGIGVVFDTYRNEDHPDHKDVSVFWNDRSRVKTEMYTVLQGCDAKVRYHEHRDDFEAGAKTSRAKVTLRGNELLVSIDPNNSGRWTECARMSLPSGLPVGWAKDAHVGLSASTGQLADNHDVIRLDTYTSAEVADVEEDKKRHSPKFAVDASSLPEERLERLENMVNIMLVKLDQMEHHVEHDMVALRDHVKSSESKMKTHDVEIDNVIKKLDKQVSALESRIKGEVSVRFNDAQLAATSWKTPFAMLFLVIIMGAMALTRWYNKLKKSHIL